MVDFIEARTFVQLFRGTILANVVQSMENAAKIFASLQRDKTFDVFENGDFRPLLFDVINTAVEHCSPGIVDAFSLCVGGGVGLAWEACHV